MKTQSRLSLFPRLRFDLGVNDEPEWIVHEFFIVFYSGFIRVIKSLARKTQTLKRFGKPKK